MGPQDADERDQPHGQGWGGTASRDDEAAVRLAAEGRWEEAADLNRRIIERSGSNHVAYNRLGRALAALGRLREARAAYQAALAIEARDPIAARNLARLLTAAPAESLCRAPASAVADLVVDSGRSAWVRLALRKASGAVMPGDELLLRLEGDEVAVRIPGGSRLGTIQGSLGNRIASLMRAGNEYRAVVAGIDGGFLVAIKEVGRSHAMAGRQSFRPPSGRVIDYGRLESGDDAPGDVDLEELFESYQEYEVEPSEQERRARREAATEREAEYLLEVKEGAQAGELLEEERMQEERDRELAAEEEEGGDW
jgi:hypothetical protein